MPLIMLAVGAGVLFSSVILWSAAFQRWRTGNPLIPTDSHSPAPWGLVDLGLAAGLWLVINLAAAAIGQSIVRLAPGDDPDALEPAAQMPLLLLQSVALLTICLLIAAALWIRHRVTAKELGWDSRHLVGDVGLGIMAFAMLAPIVYGLQALLTQIVVSKHPLIELLKKNPDPGFFAIAAFAAVLVAPLTEEFLFRVLLQSWLQRMFAGDREHTDALVFGGRQPVDPQPEVHSNEAPVSSAACQPRPTAIIVSSLFFALVHWSHGPDPIPLFVFAVGLGYLFQRTNRIVPCIVLHFLLNFCSLAVFWLMVTA